MATARRHHYVPQGYLAAFTDTGTKERQFYVKNVVSGESFRTSPKNVAHIRDFNRVDIEGQAIDALESALSSFETTAIDSIRRILLSMEFPDFNDCNVILNFLGLIAIRNPRARDSFNRARERGLHQLGELLVSDRRTFEHHIRKAAEAGYVSNTNVSFEELKSFVDERRYTIEFHPEGNSRVEFKAFDKLLPILGQRTWSLLVAPDGGPEFICADHPVTLVWKDGRQEPVGFALRQTEVFFPLGPYVGFYGTFEDPLAPVVKLKPDYVAVMNARELESAERNCFSAKESFIVRYDGVVREVPCV